MRAKLQDFLGVIALYVILAFVIICVFISTPGAKQHKEKFYNFEDQIIDGEIKRPSTLYMDFRQRVEFNQLLKLKKSFMRDLYQTAKERIFR